LAITSLTSGGRSVGIVSRGLRPWSLFVLYMVRHVLLLMVVPCLSLSVKVSPLLVVCFPCGVFN
jgi:hypothetical protein